MDLLTLALLGVMPALVIVGGLNDLTTMKIPNWISGLLVLFFFPAAFAVGLPLPQLAAHVGVAVAALLAGAGMFALRWIGGGDAKLMAAACLWLGLAGSGMFLLWTGVVGGVFCLGLLFARFHARPYLANAPGWIVHLMEPKGDIPYGVAIAAGALLAWPESPLMIRFIGF
ncbi:A24 family peptidase [Brevundimonas viscosa]|uniref:Prepilin peptidase CpaA n=1 Tax=Brevundimonas viscosa TaxID=871741 RepID=A0A1I6PD35_9CAUL|nr:prepilin peptidase [Brevundimonas viscosa]SFS38132.1 prepilin peptidase CpaA [Brevundimonas viscosa]